MKNNKPRTFSAQTQFHKFEPCHCEDCYGSEESFCAECHCDKECHHYNESIPSKSKIWTTSSKVD
jgi:hypothetical protein